MPRFAHAADLHLDSTPDPLLIGGRDRPDAFALASRRALAALVDRCLEERVDCLVLAGDIWDGQLKDRATTVYFAEQMGRLRGAGIPVIGIYGNHDAEAMKVTGKISLPGVTMLSAKKPETVRLEDKGIAIHGQSFAQRDVTDNLVLAYPPRLEGFVNVGVLHTSLAGRSDGHTTYAPCSKQDLRDRDYEYFALGHIHTRWSAPDGRIHYPGNLQGRHIREIGPRGFSFVEIDGPGATPRIEFVPVDAARWAHLEINAAGATDREALFAEIEQGLTDQLANADGRPLAVRITLSGATSLDTALRADRERTQGDLQNAAASL